MRKSLKRFWDKVKWILFIIIYTAGVVGWTIAIPMYQEMRKDADWAYTESVKLKEQRIENKNTEVSQDGEDVSFKVDVAPTQVGDEGEAEPKNSVPSSEIEKIIYEVFGKDEYQTARAVAFAESRLNTNALGKNTNGTTDCGVFQINSIHGLEDCTDPHKNIEYAKQLFDRSGWKPWVAYTTGKYLAYVK